MSEENVEYLSIRDIQEEEPIVTISCGNIEMMRFCPNGDIFVKGKLTTNDKEVVDMFREWLKTPKEII